MPYDIRIYKFKYIKPEFITENRDKYNHKFPWIKYTYMGSVLGGSPFYEALYEREVQARITEVDDYYKDKESPNLIRFNDIIKKDEKQDGCLLIPIFILGAFITFFPMVFSSIFNWALGAEYYFIAGLALVTVVAIFITTITEN